MLLLSKSGLVFSKKFIFCVSFFLYGLMIKLYYKKFCSPRIAKS